MAARLAALCIGAGLSLPVQADLWEIEPSIFLGVEYSDNLGLRANDRESGTIYRVRPQLLVSREGPKLDAVVNYRFETLFGDNERQRRNDSDTLHYLSSNASYEAIENQLGVTAAANITQQTGDPAEPPGFSNGSARGNINEVATIFMEPYYAFDLGRFTRGEVRYRYGVVEYDNPDFVDSDEGRASLSLLSAPPNAPWTWNLVLQDTRLDYDTDIDLGLRRIGLDVGYEITPRMDAVLNFGVDDNDLSDLPTQDDTDGSFWLAGIRGTIGALTTYEVRAGEQFFGDSYLLKVDRRGRRLSTSVSYEEETTSLTGQQIGYEDLLNYLNDIAGIDFPAVTPDVYVRKRFNVVLGYTLARSSWQLTLYDEDREYVTTFSGTGGDASRGARLGWNWRATGRTNVNARVEWFKSDLRERPEEPEDMRFAVRISRTVFDKANVSLSIFHDRRDATTDDNEYEENGASLGIGYTF